MVYWLVWFKLFLFLHNFFVGRCVDSLAYEYQLSCFCFSETVITEPGASTFGAKNCLGTGLLLRILHLGNNFGSLEMSWGVLWQQREGDVGDLEFVFHKCWDELGIPRLEIFR